MAGDLVASRPFLAVRDSRPLESTFSSNQSSLRVLWCWRHHTETLDPVPHVALKANTAVETRTLSATSSQERFAKHVAIANASARESTHFANLLVRRTAMKPARRLPDNAVDNRMVRTFHNQHETRSCDHRSIATADRGSTSQARYLLAAPVRWRLLLAGHCAAAGDQSLQSNHPGQTIKADDQHPITTPPTS